MGKRRSGGKAIGNKAVLGGIAGLVLLIIIIVGAFLAGQALVDIFLMLAAVVSIAAFALLGYAALQVVDLVKEIRGEVRILVGSAQDTMTEVRGTARFVGDTVVRPVSTAAGFISATRATLKSFTEPIYKRRS